MIGRETLFMCYDAMVCALSQLENTSEQCNKLH